MTNHPTNPVRPSVEEDGVLRRLHFFEQSGAVLAPALQRRKQELRGRDARATVREPLDSAVLSRG